LKYLDQRRHPVLFDVIIALISGLLIAVGTKLVAIIFHLPALTQSAVPRHGRSVAVAWTVLSAQDRQASLGHPEQLLLGHGVSLVGDPKYQPSPSVPDTWLT
jgi:hypothetical protein